MNSRDWFEGVLGWRLVRASPCYRWVDPRGNDRGIWTPEIDNSQRQWVQHVVKPMRGMGYVPYTRPDMFIWAGEKMPVAYESEIIENNIFQASLDAAEKCPEVKERLQEFKKRGKLDTR